MITLLAERHPRDVFERQIACVIADDREAQLALFADDCVWEFPFAPAGLPRRLAGRAEIRRGMMPLWESARRTVRPAPKLSIRAIHEASDPEVIVAEFDLGGEEYRLSFVQVMRVRNGLINEIREYANPMDLAQLWRRHDPAAASP